MGSGEPLLRRRNEDGLLKPKDLEMSLAYIRKAKSLRVVDRLATYGFVGQINSELARSVLCMCLEWRVVSCQCTG